MSRVTSIILLLAVVLCGTGCGPSTAPEYMQAAEKLRNQDRLTDAILYAKSSVRLDPRNPNTYKLLGDLYLLAEKPTAALRAYETARINGIESLEFKMAELKAKLGAGHYAEVIDEIGEFEAQSPETDSLLADAYFESSDYDRARNLYRKLEDPGRYATLARLERKSGRYESALQAYTKAFTVQPDGKALRGLARMQRYFDPEASVGHFQQLATIPGYASKASLELVRTYWLTGDDQKAAAYLTWLVNYKPNSRNTKFLRGIYELKRGNWEAAFSELLVLYITSARQDLLLPLAIVELEMHSPTAARTYAHRLLFRDPLNNSAAKILFLTSDDYNYPITPAVKHLLNVSHDPQLLRMIGEFALRDGHTKIALQAFTRARRALGQPEESRITFSIDLGIAPGRARLFLPVQIYQPKDIYAGNCFGLAGSLDMSLEPVGTDACPAGVLKFLLGLRALNASDREGAAEWFEAALQVDPTLSKARVLLAQTRDPRYSATGVRLATQPSKDSHQFDRQPFFFEPSPALWEGVHSNYADLFSLRIYEVAVVQTELMLARGETGPAITILNRLTKTHPSRFEAYQVLAELNMKQSSAGQWLDTVRKSMIKPLWDSWDMRMIRARIYEQTGNLKRASQTARYLQDPVDLYSSFPSESQLELAELQLRLGQKVLASDNFHQVANNALAAVQVREAARERLSELRQPSKRRVVTASSR